MCLLIIDKNLYLIVEITQLLHQNNCTYNDAEKILFILQDEFKQQRECFEYNDVDDYLHGKKTDDVSNKVVQQLNHVKGYF